jgi:Protein of unknown function (DUF3108)
MFANLKRIQKPRGANAIGRICARFAVVCAVAACAGWARADTPAAPFPLRDGETLTYSVRWGFIPSVGRIKITAEKLGVGPNSVLRVTTMTSTWGIARGLFPFDGRGESIYVEQSGLLLSSSQWSAYHDKVVKNSIMFNYGNATAIFTDDIHPEKSRTIPMPKDNPSDLILALIQTRSWNLKPGEKRDATVIFQDQFYPLTIHAEDYEYVFTSLGVFKALVLVPSMDKTPPKGMFKKGGTVRVLIEVDDDRHLPVRFSVGFAVGTGTATLMEYNPPK